MFVRACRRLSSLTAGLCAAICLPIVAMAQTPLRSSDQPAVCAHRGWLDETQLENSLVQMQATVEAGVPWVEMDLGTSADGTLYMLHDKTLDRTTTAKGPIRSYHDAQLKGVSLRTAKQVSTQAIPTFAELLRWAQGNRANIMVDLKDGDPAQAAAMLRVAGLLGRVVFLSFDAVTETRALAADAEVRVSVLVKSAAEVDAALVRAKGHPLALYVPQSAAPELFVYAARTGVPVITDAMDHLDVAAAAQGDEAYRAYLAARPVALLVTNRPLQVIKALAR